MFSFLKKALSNKILWYMATRYLTFALQFVSSLYIAEKLGPYYWGIWSFILLWINIGNMLNWGIGNSINILLVHHKTDSELCAEYCYNGFILSCLTMIPAVLFVVVERVIGIPYFAKYQVGNYIYLVLLIVCIGYLNNFFVNVFRVKNCLFAVAFSQSAFPVSCFLLMFFANGKNLLALLTGGYLAAVLVSLILFLCGRYIDWKQKINMMIMRETFLKGFFLFCYNACFLLIVLSTKTLISYYYSVEVFGYFAFAFSLANAAMLLVDSITFVAFPKMIDVLRTGTKDEIWEKIYQLHRFYLTGISGIIFLMIPCCWVLLYFIPKYAPSFKIFVVILFALGLYSVCFGYNIYMLAQNEEKKMAMLVSSALLLNIVISYLLAGVFFVPIEYCAFGVMITYLVYSLAVNSFATVRIGKRIDSHSFLFWIPLHLLIPVLISLVILFYGNNILLLSVPPVLFLLIGFKEIVQLVRQLLNVVHHPEIIDIKTKA